MFFKLLMVVSFLVVGVCKDAEASAGATGVASVELPAGAVETGRIASNAIEYFYMGLVSRATFSDEGYTLCEAAGEVRFKFDERGSRIIDEQEFAAADAACARAGQ